MARRNVNEFRTGPLLDQYRAEHPRFIRDRLILGSDQLVSKHDLNEAYGSWRGITNRDRRTGRLSVSQDDLHNLYLLLRLTEGVRENDLSFRGVGLRAIQD